MHQLYTNLDDENRTQQRRYTPSLRVNTLSVPGIPSDIMRILPVNTISYCQPAKRQIALREKGSSYGTNFDICVEEFLLEKGCQWHEDPSIFVFLQFGV